MEINTDNLIDGKVIELLKIHHQDMMQHSPLESVHALNVEALKSDDLTFWSARVGGELAGCGALKELDSTQGEIKAMRTASQFLRKGVAAAILQKILVESESRGYTRLSLETGSMAAFAPAHCLYKDHGFKECGPFADYVEDPYSLFMTKQF